MSNYDKVDAFIDKNLSQSLDELKKYVAQPSISAQNLGLKECAQLVKEMLEKRGFTAEIMATEGAPVVFAERKGNVDKTILIYNHYDVQPPEPLELWDSPPFEPEIRDGKMYGRGVSDDKGHLTSRLHAIDAILAEDGELPCNIKFIIEGEEETASVHLHEFISNNVERLKADACIWEFGSVDHRDRPQQYLGLRGICYVELSVTSLGTDVHSGIGGSIFPNAAWRLTWALSTLKGVDERIRIPGFYDDVVQPTDRDREFMEKLPDLAEDYKTRFGVQKFIKGLEGGMDLKLEEVFTPTCTICGLTSGYQGPGSKTVQPASASAKVDFRLVPNQMPKDILKKLRAHLDAEGFSDVEIKFLGGEPAARTDPDHPFVKLVSETAEEVYDAKMDIVPMIGGSGPNYPFVHELGLPVVCMGIGYPNTRAHAPNENFRIDLYAQHAKHTARVIREFAK
ncbi:MAG TPA: M20/M25/M40 family metallo-hydrolase [Anaerolineales bacterium]|nr:M20/M25/M40 family metallo-hydrolase [Anaerolineales bacterium]HNB39860.1 M20/M25/M40 family metallo-hydrolase [Anaerolineales bacterium]HNF94366.1 M20/M25/M40 family metallo-hydrolase [Anaerolineales bacterium]